MLLNFPELEAYHQYVLLAFHGDIAMFMEQASKTSEAVQLSKAASLLRKDMLSHKWNFDNTNSNQPTDQSVPPSLLEFVSMIEHGAENGALKSGLALAQLLQFNSTGKYKEGAKSHRHTKSRGTPIAVYLDFLSLQKPEKDSS